MKLVDALRQNDTLTENGMATNSSSLNEVVDLFYTIGAMRGQDKQRLIAKFLAAFHTDSTRSMKILFWVRDIRGGAGERQIFRDIIKYLADNYTNSLKKNLKYIPEYGRWDDLLSLENTKLESAAFHLIKEAISEGGTLAEKWMPRKGKTASKLRKYMGVTPKEYRKLLVNGTSVVETLMCAKRWKDIDFSKIPSLASARYQKSFLKNAEKTYRDYIDQLKEGKTKINASAVYPYDVVKSLNSGNFEVANEQWKALPDYLKDTNEMILPMVDTSGSMAVAAGNNKNVSCMDIAVSLGLYISERNEGLFKNAFLTFSSNPKLQYLSGSLKDRYTQLYQADWGMNTNIKAAFDMILKQAVKHKLNQSEMPDKILILSDMQFDSAINNNRYYGRNNPGDMWNPTAQELIEEMYAEAGYKVPKIVYWNIQSRNGDIPVKFDKDGTALISGFSPAIMTSILGSDDFSPISIMDKTILSDRYAQIEV